MLKFLKRLTVTAIFSGKACTDATKQALKNEVKKFGNSSGLWSDVSEVVCTIIDGMPEHTLDVNTPNLTDAEIDEQAAELTDGLKNMTVRRLTSDERRLSVSVSQVGAAQATAQCTQNDTSCGSLATTSSSTSTSTTNSQKGSKNTTRDTSSSHSNGAWRALLALSLVSVIHRFV